MSAFFQTNIHHSYKLSLCILILLLLPACDNKTEHPPQDPTVPASTAWYEVYFTDPASESGFRGGPDANLAEAIDRAQYSIKLAVYRLDLWSIRDALIRAYRRGVDVQVIVESDNKLEREIYELEQAGIRVLGDRRESLMHHKFVVIDGLDTWTGSMNFTVNGAYRNNNNLLHIRSKDLAENYLHEFNEMYERDGFGVLSSRDTPFPQIELENTLIESMFSPDDHVVFRIIELIKEAEQRIEIMFFTLTHDAIADALLQKAHAGVEVVGVAEASMIDQQGSDAQRLRDAGLDIRLIDHEGFMHHKVIILDGDRVLLGSYNFSRSAEERNDENVLIIHNRSIAQEFHLEFETLYDSSNGR